MNSRIRTAIFPVAGLGTRLWPATKSVPKELLPIVDTPVIQFAVNEAKEAGIERMVFVSHPSKPAIESYLRGLDLIANPRIGKAPRNPQLMFTMQEKRKGLGHAVLCGRRFSLPGPVAVILPDDLIFAQPGCLAQMVAAYESGHMVATMKVSPNFISSYGVLGINAKSGRIIHAENIVEKPKAENAPSNHAVVGRYILDEGIFDTLAQTLPGTGGEIQLTDAIAKDLESNPLHGYQFAGQRFDCGTRQGLVAATVAQASLDPELFELMGNQFSAARLAAE